MPRPRWRQVGGKGAALARLMAAGLPVPAGYTVTTAAYRRFVAEHGLQEPLLAALSAVALADPATLEAAAEQIAHLFAEQAMPAEIAAEICRAYGKLGEGICPWQCVPRPRPKTAGAVICRSARHLPQHAGRSDGAQCRERCWASLWTARAINYRARGIGVAHERSAWRWWCNRWCPPMPPASSLPRIR